MGFFQPLTSSQMSYDDYIASVVGGRADPQYVGISALKNSDILTAVSIVAGDISRFPIMVKDENDEIVSDDDLHYLLNVRATGNATARAWKFAMAVNAILTGNAYSRILRDPLTGQALQFVFYKPSETTVEERKDSSLIYRFKNTTSSDEVVCEAQDVIHWKFFTANTILGRSPLLSLGDEIAMQEAGTSTLNRFFKSGFSSGIIKLKGSQLNAEARNIARKDFEKMREGSLGGSPLIFDDTQEYIPLEIDTNVLQVITSNNFSTAQIAKALRVPSYKLGVNSPNQSVSQLMEDYVKNDLPFYFDAVTSELSMKIFPPNLARLRRFEFDTRSVTGRHVDELVKLVNNGLLTPNQAVVELGKKKSTDPNMDRYQSSLNYVFLDRKEDYQNNQGARKEVREDGETD